MAHIFLLVHSFLQQPVSLVRQATTATTQQGLTGFGSLPLLRTDHAVASIPPNLVAPIMQQSIGGSAISNFPSVGLMGLRNVQLQTFPRIIPAPIAFSQGPSPANLLEQLQAQRDQATVELARSMKLTSDRTNQRPRPAP